MFTFYREGIIIIITIHMAMNDASVLITMPINSESPSSYH